MRLRSRCPKSHPNDCSTVKGHLRSQREYCVVDAEDCRKPYALATIPRRRGRWSVRKEEEAQRERATKRAETLKWAWDKTKEGAGAVAEGVSQTVRTSWRRSKFFVNQYQKILEADSSLPQPLPSDPKKATAVLQQYLAQHFTLEPKSRSSCKAPAKTLDLWQQAASIPTLRLSEMLVVADPGTGKSLVWASVAREWYEKGMRIVVLVNDQSQANSQFRELMASPSWHDLACNGSLEKITSVGERHKTKRILLITYVKAGNMIQDHIDSPETPCALDGTAIIMDEVHELATPENAKRWAPSMRAVVKYLKERRYGRLLGLTATPLVSIPTFLTLVEQFTPVDAKKKHTMKPITLEDLELVTQEATPDQKTCGVEGTQYVSHKLYEKFNGLQIFYYSADRDAIDFARFKPPEVLDVDVPVEGKDMMSVARKDGWNANKLNHQARYTKIVNAAAPVAWNRLDPKRKTLLLMSTKGMAVKMYDALVKRNTDGRYALQLLTGDADAAEQAKLKKAFATGASNTVLVTHADRFGTGHTFDDTDAPARLGARLLMSVQLRSYKAVMQLEGRARRRMSHAGYAVKDRNIERVVLIPRAVVKSGCVQKKKTDCTGVCTWVTNRGCATRTDPLAPPGTTSTEIRRTCERVFHEAVKAERDLYETILGVLYLVSYGRDAFWNLRPAFVNIDRSEIQGEKNRMERASDFLKKHAKIALDAAQRTLRAEEIEVRGGPWK